MENKDATGIREHHRHTFSVLWPHQYKLVADIPKPPVEKAFCTWMDELKPRSCAPWS
jgi:hypothetical protein